MDRSREGCIPCIKLELVCAKKHEKYCREWALIIDQDRSTRLHSWRFDVDVNCPSMRPLKVDCSVASIGGWLPSNILAQINGLEVHQAQLAVLESMHWWTTELAELKSNHLKTKQHFMEWWTNSSHMLPTPLMIGFCRCEEARHGPTLRGICEVVKSTQLETLTSNILWPFGRVDYQLRPLDGRTWLGKGNYPPKLWSPLNNASYTTVVLGAKFCLWAIFQ